MPNQKRSLNEVVFGSKDAYQNLILILKLDLGKSAHHFMSMFAHSHDSQYKKKPQGHCTIQWLLLNEIPTNLCLQV
jgi:hypothetical protein